MGLLSKIKNALFEEEEVIEEEPIAKQVETKHEVERPIIINDYLDDDYEEEIVEEPISQPIRQTRVENSNVQAMRPRMEENIVQQPVRQKRQEKPIIFDVDDFIQEEKPEIKYQEPKKEEKILYGGYEAKPYDKTPEKDKFKPSPIISPVYGIVETEYQMDDYRPIEKSSLDRLFIEEKKQPLDFDTVRQKAYGYAIKEEVIEEEPYEEERSLLYEMQEHTNIPAIDKISLGDAEEYFEDLGLEYNVDYTDLAKLKMTRAKKNKELTEVVDEEIKENKRIENEFYRQKDVLRFRREEKEEAEEEKNLYDLIDMMYDDK